MNQYNLNNKIAIVTGASRGIGKEIVKSLLLSGTKVALLSRSEELLKQVCDEFDSLGDTIYFDANVTHYEDIKRISKEIFKKWGEINFLINNAGITNDKLLLRMSENDWDSVVSGAVGHFGKIDILVNNAGIALFGTLEDTSNDDWERVMNVNAKGVFLGTKAVIPEMRKVGGGSIINISSVSGLIGQATVQPVYNASKGAVRVFTKAAAVQYAKEGIRVNSIHPGSVDTLMISHRIDTPEAQQRRTSLTPLDRVAQPIEIAYGVLYLASDEASFVTGSELVIDGGFTAK